MSDATIVVTDEKTVVVDDPSKVIVVETNGSRGAVGPAGPAGVQQVYVSTSAPTGTPSQYMWVQTNMGTSGEDITFWVEDGDA